MNAIAQEIENVSNDQMIADGFRKVSQSEFMALVYRLAERLN